MSLPKKHHIKSRIEEVLKNKDIIQQNTYSKSLEELIEELKTYQYELEFQNEELLRIQEELEKSMDAYRNLFQEAPSGYVILNEEFEIIDFNKSFHKTCNHLQFCSKGTDFRKLISPESQDVFHLFWNGLLSDPKTEMVEINFCNNNDKLVVARICGVFEKEYRQIRLAVTDITEIKNYQKELIRLNQEKDKFFFILAHDIRSPMHTFLGLTELLSSGAKTLSMDEIQEIGDKLHRSSTNLNNLIENLLHWARIQQGNIPYAPKWQLLKPVFKETEQLLSPLFEQKELNFTADVPENLAIYADPQMLMFVLRNTLVNAMKFTRNKGTIKLIAQPDKTNEVLIMVSDSGIGMNQAQLAKLFKITESSGRKGTDNEPGTGMGLILCKEVIDKHGGRIWIDSQVDYGSTVYMIFPNKIFPA